MRLAKIAKLVSKSRLCDVYSDEYGTGVYISVGKAIYHVQDLPMPCARDQMRIMLDIPTKKMGKGVVRYTRVPAAVGHGTYSQRRNADDGI